MDVAVATGGICSNVNVLPVVAAVLLFLKAVTCIWNVPATRRD